MQIPTLHYTGDYIYIFLLMEKVYELKTNNSNKYSS